MRDKEGRFKAGAPSENRLPVGAVRIRTRHGRRNERRAFIKVAEPNVWILRARYVWEQAHGPIPRGMGIHHKDLDKLNDAVGNLELVSKAEHLDEHRADFDHEARVAASSATRRRLRWSTKSTTKRTGRPPTWTEEQFAEALAAVRGGESAYSVERRLGISRTTLCKRLRST